MKRNDDDKDKKNPDESGKTPITNNSASNNNPAAAPKPVRRHFYSVDGVKNLTRRTAATTPASQAGTSAASQAGTSTQAANSSKKNDSSSPSTHHAIWQTLNGSDNNPLQGTLKNGAHTIPGVPGLSKIFNSRDPEKATRVSRIIGMQARTVGETTEIRRTPTSTPTPASQAGTSASSQAGTSTQAANSSKKNDSSSPPTSPRPKSP